MKCSRRMIICWLSVVLASVATARADFLTPDSVDFKSILMAPPAEDSDQTKKEIAQILQLQQTRTLPDELRAKREADLSVWIYADVLGRWFRAPNLPVTAKFFGEVLSETGAITHRAKSLYNRRRPFLVDDRIKPCFAVDHSTSYPSGHSDAATVFGLVLGKMFPDQQEALTARSRQVGDDRVVAGVHYPSDVEAGRTLGEAIFKQMEKSPDFQADLQKAIDECKGRRPATDNK